MQTILGFQTTIDFYGCNRDKINSKAFIEQVLVSAAKQMNLSVVKTTIHAFSPIGISGVVVIKESHLAIHTWPEHQYVALDFFTCNQSYELDNGIQWLKEMFEAHHTEVSSEKRGNIKLAHKYIKCLDHQKNTN